MTPQETTEWLQVTAGPLIGVIVGALLSWFVSARLERSHFKHERAEKLAALRRDAIAAALEWFEPMRNAQIAASSLVTAAIRGDFDHESFLGGYPYLLGELKKHDLTGAQRAVLPGTVYSRGHRIVRQLDELRFLGIQHGQRAAVMGEKLSGLDEVSKKLVELESDIASLESDLRAAFQSTFD